MPLPPPLHITEEEAQGVEVRSGGHGVPAGLAVGAGDLQPARKQEMQSCCVVPRQACHT